jgi:aromatic ring-opening dioxygenase catalytic subunit (LigB family)
MTLPTFFISHGGGPWPFMTGQMREMHSLLEAALRDMPRQLAAPPKAVLMVSAHWEEADFTVMGNPHPGMVYDYFGFPANTYQVRYPAPGSPELAQRVQALAEAVGLPCGMDRERGFDHGMFAPMSVIYPDADVPVVQLSLRSSYDPQAHMALGRALAPLRDEGVLIIGSGLSYHNLQQMRGGAAQPASKRFDDWLGTTLMTTAGAERADLLEHWADAPGARQSHPREDHLLPLMVAAGAAQDDRAVRVYHQEDFLGGAVVSSFRFDAN